MSFQTALYGECLFTSPWHLVFVRRELLRGSLPAQSSGLVTSAQKLAPLAAWPPGTHLTMEKSNLLLWQKIKTVLEYTDGVNCIRRKKFLKTLVTFIIALLLFGQEFN